MTIIQMWGSKSADFIVLCLINFYCGVLFRHFNTGLHIRFVPEKPAYCHLVTVSYKNKIFLQEKVLPLEQIAA